MLNTHPPEILFFSSFFFFSFFPLVFFSLSFSPFLRFLAWKERTRINHSGARDLRPRLFPNDSGKCRFFRGIRVIRESRFEAGRPSRFSSLLRGHHGTLSPSFWPIYRSITSWRESLRVVVRIHFYSTISFSHGESRKISRRKIARSENYFSRDIANIRERCCV